MVGEVISLYECQNARVNGPSIKCAHGHRLSTRSNDGSISLERLVKGQPLVLTVCQYCPQFDRNGGPLLTQERGWKPSEHEKRLLKIK